MELRNPKIISNPPMLLPCVCVCASPIAFIIDGWISLRFFLLQVVYFLFIFLSVFVAKRTRLLVFFLFLFLRLRKVQILFSSLSRANITRREEGRDKKKERNNTTRYRALLQLQIYALFTVRIVITSFTRECNFINFLTHPCSLFFSSFYAYVAQGERERGIRRRCKNN